MEDLQTYRARIGLYRHRLPSKQNVPSHKRTSYRQLEQKRRQDRTKLKKSRMLPANKLHPVASSGKMAFGITRGFAIIVIAILLMAGLTSGNTETVQSSQEFNTYFQESHVNGTVVTQTLQHNYVMLSFTCDCLLGNAGVHAYNGNPRTPLRDDSENMDWAANADTPSGSQLEVGGAERSTLQRSQLTDHIQKLEIDIRKQHADMIRELNGYISPELKNEWNLFRNGLTPHLTRREIYGSCVTFVGDHCEILSSKGIIQLGDYNVLFDVVNRIDVRAGDIVKRATTAIEEIRMRISAIQLQDFGEAVTDLKGLNMSPNLPNDNELDTNDLTTDKREEKLNSTENDSSADETVTEIKQTARLPTEHDELSGARPVSDPMANNDQSAHGKPITAQCSSENIEPDLSLYRYQKELAKPGLEGHNCIVVAPTNSGKTHVAIRIIQQHLREGRGKVIFLVPTSALATQQRDRCYELLKCPVKVMTGGSQAKEKYVDMSIHLKIHDVIVATPQILVNCLLGNDVPLALFSLIVFDECHRTYEDTPYNAVMRIYWHLKLTSEYVRLPQILGMTASLGSGQANDQSSANTWVKSIMANMDCQKLVTVKENIEELERIISDTDTEIVETKERRNQSFGHLVNDMMATIESNINRLDGELKRPPASRSDPPYTQWCSNLKKQVSSTPDNDLHRSLKIYADYLEVYHRALLIYQDARVSDAVRYLKEEMDEMYFEETAVEADHEMYRLFQEKQQLMEINDDGDQENPKLREVQDRVCNQFSADPDSRAIIYVKTIELARSMEAWMSECPVLQHLKAVRFVGAHANVGVGGITKMEQDTILKAFRKGDHKVVIGTSVLEEGLDVPRCNLVILYDHVTNEIQRVQTRGRIRRDNSHFVLIVSESGKAAQKERVNERRELMGSAAVTLVQHEIARDPHGFQERQQVDQLEEKRKRDAMVLQELKQLENNPVYEVKCNQCRSFLFLSSDLRKIKDHHTVVAGGMGDRLSPGPRRSPRFGDGNMEHGVAKLYCKNCQIRIGSVNKSMSLFFPMPRIDQITFSRNDDYKTCKQWKAVNNLFGIKTFCPIEDKRFILSLPADEREFYTS